MESEQKLQVESLETTPIRPVKENWEAAHRDEDGTVILERFVNPAERSVQHRITSAGRQKIVAAVILGDHQRVEYLMPAGMTAEREVYIRKAKEVVGQWDVQLAGNEQLELDLNEMIAQRKPVGFGTKRDNDGTLSSDSEAQKKEARAIDVESPQSESNSSVNGQQRTGLEFTQEFIGIIDKARRLWGSMSKRDARFIICFIAAVVITAIVVIVFFTQKKK